MAKATKKPKTKGKVGRPAIEFDLKQVEAFGYCKATYETMANWFGCAPETIRNRLADHESDFCLAYKRGDSRLKVALSEAQIQLALSGNATMLVWLGKQYLGQSDTPQTSDDNRGIEFDGFNSTDSE